MASIRRTAASHPHAKLLRAYGPRWHVDCSQADTHQPIAMRQILLTASLIFSLGLAACADHAGSIVSIDPPVAPPIGPSDSNNVGPNPSPAGDDLSSALPGGGGGFNGGGTPPTGDGGGGSSGGGSGGGKGEPGGGGGGGGPAGSPVPEPGTMLLVGTGLAGAALMRRRRQVAVVTEGPQA